MPYPTVPDLVAFDGDMRPNLVHGGPYDEQLTAIETYLAQLGSYIDDTVLAAAQAAQSTAQAAQATANANAATIGDWATDHPDSTISQAVTSTNESVSELSGKLDTTTQTANTAASDASAALTWTRNASAVSANVPTKINSTGNGTDTVAAQLFGSDGNGGTLLDKLALLLSNLMLAAPNGDTTKLLGYLADNSADLTTATARPRSSSALTWASEQGGYEGNVYNVPVAIDASGLVRLDVEGEFVIHAGETLFVTQSEYTGFTEGSLLGYSGSGATLNGTGVNIVGDLLTLFEPATSGGSVPDNVVLYDANPGLKSSLYVMSGEDRQDINTITMTADDASLQVGPGAFNEGGATRITPKSILTSSTSPGESWGVDVSKTATPLTSEQLASAEVLHDAFNTQGTVRVSPL